MYEISREIDQELHRGLLLVFLITSVREIDQELKHNRAFYLKFPVNPVNPIILGTMVPWAFCSCRKNWINWITWKLQAKCYVVLGQLAGSSISLEVSSFSS